MLNKNRTHQLLITWPIAALTKCKFEVVVIAFKLLPVPKIILVRRLIFLFSFILKHFSSGSSGTTLNYQLQHFKNTSLIYLCEIINSFLLDVLKHQRDPFPSVRQPCL